MNQKRTVSQDQQTDPVPLIPTFFPRWKGFLHHRAHREKAPLIPRISRIKPWNQRISLCCPARGCLRPSSLSGSRRKARLDGTCQYSQPPRRVFLRDPDKDDATRSVGPWLGSRAISAPNIENESVRIRGISGCFCFSLRFSALSVVRFCFGCGFAAL